MTGCLEGYLRVVIYMSIFCWFYNDWCMKGYLRVVVYMGIVPFLSLSKDQFNRTFYSCIYNDSLIIVEDNSLIMNHSSVTLPSPDNNRF